MASLEEWQAAKQRFFLSKNVGNLIEIESYRVECDECNFKASMTFNQVMGHFNYHIAEAQREIWKQQA